MARTTQTLLFQFWVIHSAYGTLLGFHPVSNRADLKSLHKESRCGVSKPLFKKPVKVEPEEHPDLVEQATSAVVWVLQRLRLPFWPQQPDKPKQEEKRSELECLMPYLMNCTHWHELAAQRPCPRQCAFVAQLKPFACTFTCVNASQCHYANVNMPFADPSTLSCGASRIEGCMIASENGTRCEQCRRHFTLGSIAGYNQTFCIYEREGSLIWIVERLHAMGYWGWLLPSLILLGLVFQLCQKLVKHWDLLTFARIHHHLCKVRMNPKVYAGSPLYSLFENVHTKFIIGIGLPLYYNSVVFLFLVSVVLFLGAHVALASGDSSLFNYAGHHGSYSMSLYPTTTGVLDASICGWAMSDDADARVDVGSTTRRFMERLATVVLVLYFSVLAVMLLHAKCQQRHTEWFEARHLTMKDMALGFAGFPPNATDELQIGRFLFEQFEKPVQAVSIGYDLTGRVAEVQALVDRHLAYADAEARGGYPVGIGIAPVPGSRDEEQNLVGPEAMRCGCKLDKERVRNWFGDGAKQPMLSTGYVWAVFNSTEDREYVLEQIEALGMQEIIWRDHASGAEFPLHPSIPKCEPTNIRWANLRFGIWNRRLRFCAATLLFLGACGCLIGLVYWPYAIYVTSYLDEAGRFPQGFMMGLLAFVMGLSWWFMCMVIGVCVGYIGFHTVENEYLWIYTAFTHFVILASACNVYLTWYYSRQVWDDPAKSWLQQFRNTVAGPVSNLRDLRHEIDLGFRVFQLLVPGVLFTPCLLCPINNFIVPYFRESAMLVLFGRNKSGREAERYLEPLPVGLCWDYQGHATLPFCCGLTLFVLSPSMWWTHMYLCVFCFFFYIFQRLMHLRVCKKMFFTASKLDRFVLYFGWGLLLAELAACHAYWKVRLQLWPHWSMPAAIAASYAGYWLLLRCLVGVKWPLRMHSCPMKPTKRPQQSLASSMATKTCEDFCYNWLNVNPVHVLKSQYCSDLMGGTDPVVFYEPGKEYLQLFSGSETPIHRCSSDNKRWKTNHGIWLELEGLGCISPLLESDDTYPASTSTSAELLQKRGAAAVEDDEPSGPGHLLNICTGETTKTGVQAGAMAAVAAAELGVECTADSVVTFAELHQAGETGATPEAGNHPHETEETIGHLLQGEEPGSYFCSSKRSPRVLDHGKGGYNHCRTSKSLDRGESWHADAPGCAFEDWPDSHACLEHMGQESSMLPPL